MNMFDRALRAVYELMTAHCVEDGIMASIHSSKRVDCLATFHLYW